MNKIFLILIFGIVAISASFVTYAISYTHSAYFHCDPNSTYHNCQVIVDRIDNEGAEYIWKHNGNETWAMFERYNGTMQLAQRVNLNAYQYVEQWNVWPGNKVQEIHWGNIYVISKEGYFGQLIPYNNGTVKFKLGDPNWPSCTNC